MNRLALAAALLGTAAAPLAAETHRVEAAQGAAALQEALILAKPGDVIEMGEGRFTLTDGLSLDVDGVTLRGMGMDRTVLDFTGQQGAGEGLLVTSDNVTLRDFAVENPRGDGIKSKGADMIIYSGIRVEWTGGPKETNGAYGIYPVESTGVLVVNSRVSGASDAGIYVGQSRDITVRENIVTFNVAGIEIENSRNALVTSNIASRNTGGLLVFDLPGLPVMGGGNVILRDNVVKDNDTANFAPKGNIVASVRRGTGVLVMANDGVLIEANAFENNPTAHVMVVAYTQPFVDARYNPPCEERDRRAQRLRARRGRSADRRQGDAAGGFRRGAAAGSVGRDCRGRKRPQDRGRRDRLDAEPQQARPVHCRGPARATDADADQKLGVPRSRCPCRAGGAAEVKWPAALLALSLATLGGVVAHARLKAPPIADAAITGNGFPAKLSDYGFFIQPREQVPISRPRLCAQHPAVVRRGGEAALHLPAKARSSPPTGRACSNSRWARRSSRPSLSARAPSVA